MARLCPITSGDTVPSVMQIGEAITRERERRGFTRAELARQVGVSWQQVQKWEQQDTISAPRLLQIAIALGAPLSAFLGDQVRELEGQAGLSPEEQAWVELRRQLAADGRLEEAERLLELDEEGRRLVAVYWSLPPEGRRRLVREARKLEIDFEGVGTTED